MKGIPQILIIFIALFVVGYIFLGGRSFDLPEGESMPLSEIEESTEDDRENRVVTTSTVPAPEQSFTSREIFVTEGVKHSIPVEDIRQGCFGRDCIPSVDDPEFISRREADNLLPDDTIGIGLIFNGETRFYPFNMLVTREIVNDDLNGVPLAVTYCPLCGTGIVFDRRVGDKVYEFGVSGMLWQSNLLMYNREDNEEDISLWSQVLGEAVLGTDTGTKLAIIPSDVVRYTDWAKEHRNTKVLNTGRIGDPYNGDYFGVAQHFRPDFDEDDSPLLPTAYVFGVEVDGQFKAYPTDELSVGEVSDTFAGKTLSVTKDATGVVRIDDIETGETLPIVIGFWFSWVAAHPDTELYSN